MPTATDTLPKEFQLQATGSISLAAQASKEGKPKFKLIANTGIPMQGVVPGYYDPVIIDMAGASFDKPNTPVIMDHDTDKRVGHAVKQSIKNNRIVAEGIVSSLSESAKSFVDDSKEGYPFQVSVGADIKATEYIPEGESAQVNGKTWKGPLIIARATVIREFSITVLGADSNTTAVITAKRYLNEEIDTMKDPLSQTADLEARRKAAADEEDRIDQIRAVAKQFSQVEKITIGGEEMSLSAARRKAMESNMSPNEFELACRYADLPRANRAPQLSVTA